MYDSIRIQNFRGLRDLEINDLGRVNLLVGANNVGKTSVLEALALLHMHLDAYELKLIVESRGYNAGAALDGSLSDLVMATDQPLHFVISAKEGSRGTAYLVGDRALPPSPVPDTANLIAHYWAGFDRNSREAVILTYHYRDLKSGEVMEASSVPQQLLPRIALGVHMPYPRRYERGHFGEVAFLPSLRRLAIQDLAELISVVQGRPGPDPLVPILAAFDQRIVGINVGYSIEQQQPTVMYKQEDLGGLPVQVLGDGVRRLIDIALQIPLSANGFGLIDEIDSGVFFENLPALWRILNELSEQNLVQVFVTTHSWECVSAAVKSFRHQPDDFRLHRLSRRGDEIVTTTYGHEDAEAALEINVEVR